MEQAGGGLPYSRSRVFYTRPDYSLNVFLIGGAVGAILLSPVIDLVSRKIGDLTDRVIRNIEENVFSEKKNE